MSSPVLNYSTVQKAGHAYIANMSGIAVSDIVVPSTICFTQSNLGKALDQNEKLPDKGQGHLKVL